jgi:hypothetical protein
MMDTWIVTTLGVKNYNDPVDGHPSTGRSGGGRLRVLVHGNDRIQ